MVMRLCCRATDCAIRWADWGGRAIKLNGSDLWKLFNGSSIVAVPILGSFQDGMVERLFFRLRHRQCRRAQARLEGAS